MATGTAASSASPPRPGRGIIVALALAVAVAGGVFVTMAHSTLQMLGHVGYIGAFGIAALGNAVVAVPFPWLVVVGPMGVVYDPVWLTLWASAGAVTGAIIPYFLGSIVPVPWLVARLSGKALWFRVAIVVLVSLAPAFSYPTLAAGVLKMRLLPALAITAISESAKIWLAVHLVPVGLRAVGL